jgi:anti-sigma28 factor (negative regulator of flagellin synthesis)
MTINEVMGSGYVPDPIKNKKERDAQLAKPASTDKAQVSEEAKSLFEAERTKKIQEIREKIESGYYSQREVTEHVADALLSALRKPSTEA